MLKTEKIETEESDTTGIPSKQLPSHEPEQKVTSVLLVEVGKEIMGLYTKTKKGGAPVLPLSWVFAYPLASLHTDLCRCNASSLLGQDLACSAQLQAQLLLAPVWLQFCSMSFHGIKAWNRRWMALCTYAAGPGQAPGAAEAKLDAPEVVGPDGPIMPMLEEFGTPGSEGSGVSPAQVCMLVPCPLLLTGKCRDLPCTLSHILWDGNARDLQLGRTTASCTIVMAHYLAVH